MTDHTKICPTCQNEDDVSETSCLYCGSPYRGAVYPVYVEKDFSLAHVKVIDKANAILSDYERQGFKLTLRQLYYQFVSSDTNFPNTDASYKRLGNIINDARLAGYISYERIEDRGRTHSAVWSQPSVVGAFESLQYNYSEDMWSEQDTYVEVWVEKDALSGVVQRPCRRFDVSYMACRGYMSASAQWAAGERYKAAANAGKDLVLIHLGDHDPSGIDMTRDNGTRLSMYVDEPVEVRRIGLNMDQVEEFRPPPNPAKVTDSRAREYIAKYGDLSWELDALTPNVIDSLITTEIKKFINTDRWNDLLDVQAENRKVLQAVEANASEVLEWARLNYLGGQSDD